MSRPLRGGGEGRATMKNKTFFEALKNPEIAATKLEEALVAGPLKKRLFLWLPQTTWDFFCVYKLLIII